MTTLKLKAVHRILIKGMLDSSSKSGRTLSELNKLLKLLDKIDFTPEEAKEIDLRVENQTLRWNVTKLKEEGSTEMIEVDVEKEFELSEEQRELLKTIIKEKDEKKEFSLPEAAPFTDIAEQVGYEVEK